MSESNTSIKPLLVKYLCRECKGKKEKTLYPNSIRELRLRLSKTAIELSESIGINPSYWSILENGKRSIDSVSHGNLLKIAAALGVEVDDLFIKSKAA